MGEVRETFWLIMFMANLSIKFCELSVSRSLLKSHYGNGTGICESFPVPSTFFFVPPLSFALDLAKSLLIVGCVLVLFYKLCY